MREGTSQARVHPLAQTLFRAVAGEGLRSRLRRGEQSTELTATALSLAPGRSIDYAIAGEESVCVLLQGSGTMAAGVERWSVSRDGPFSTMATAIWLPPAVALRLETVAGLEAFIVSTPAPDGGTPTLVGAADVVAEERGQQGCRRTVCHLFTSDPFAKRLIVGETIVDGGNWASFPPHKHDGLDGEPALEELYFYRLEPSTGFAHQMLYSNGHDAVVHVVRDDDLVLIPYGYHPLSIPPGHRLYYLWALAGNQRSLQTFTDPAFR